MLKTELLYTCVIGAPGSLEFAARFAATFHEFPPAADHRLTILCNGGPPDLETAAIFAGIGAHFFPRKNGEGRDLEGYQDAARGPAKDATAVLCLGESVYFHRAGWLRRLAETWQELGPGFYGPFSSNVVRGHLQTTAFMCSPQLLRGYPTITCHAERYSFEHGPFCLWRRARAMGLPVRLVTWDGEWRPEEWRQPENIMWKGDQTNLLFWCNHSDAFTSMPTQAGGQNGSGASTGRFNEANCNFLAHDIFSGGSRPIDMSYACGMMADQMESLRKSGLLAATDEMIIGVNGGADDAEVARLFAPSKARIVPHGAGTTTEIPTMNLIRQVASRVTQPGKCYTDT